MSSAQDYREKIGDLHAELVAKTQELQKENEKFNSIMENKVKLLERVAELEAIVVATEDALAKLDDVLQEKKEYVNGMYEPSKERARALKSSVKLLEGAIKKSKATIRFVEKEEARLVTIRDQIKTKQAKISKLEKQEAGWNKKVIASQKVWQSCEDAVNKRDEEVTAKVDKYKRDHAAFHALKKNFSFYARRFLRIYRKSGMAIPDKIVTLIDKIK